MGGRYGVESELGVGSKFWVEIPHVVSRELKRREVGKEQGESGLNGVSLNILIADDNELTLRVMSRLVGRAGHRYETVEDGGEALKRIRQRRQQGGEMYDIIFLDEMMPKMRGSEVIENVRRMGLTIPLVSITGSGEERTRDELLRRGATAVLNKPVKWEELDKILKTVPSGGESA